jgi:hypothetical protein
MFLRNVGMLSKDFTVISKNIDIFTATAMSTSKCAKCDSVID